MTRTAAPLTCVAYLLVLREQSPQILDEFLHSYASLRRFHPDVPVFVYHENTTPEQIAFLRRLGIADFCIAVDRSGRYVQHRYSTVNGFRFPELFVLAAKIDALLLTPGSTLFLDADTEVRAPLDEVFGSATPWMHLSEGLLAEHDRDWSSVLDAADSPALGWRGARDELQMYNSGSIWVPENLKTELYRAKEFLWNLLAQPPAERGDNRLDEQVALSIALQEAASGPLGEVAPRVYHYWLEKYEGEPWYRQRCTQREVGGDVVLVPPAPESDPELAPLVRRQLAGSAQQS